jgi:hypothetical protein
VDGGLNHQDSEVSLESLPRRRGTGQSVPLDRHPTVWIRPNPTETPEPPDERSMTHNYGEPVRNYNRTIQILRSQFYEKRSNRIRLLADQWPRSFTRKGTPSFNPYRPSAIDGHKVLSLHDSRPWRRRPPRGGETVGFANPTNPSTILQLAHPSPNR